MIKGFLSTSDLCERYKISSRTIPRWFKSKNFPLPKIRGCGVHNKWSIDDIEAWEQQLN